MELLSPDLVDRLRDALLRAGFSYDGVAGALGPLAHAALSRNETTPGLRATRGGSPLETLTRLWPLQAAVDLAAAEAALPGLVDPLCNAGVLERSVGSVRARIDIRPYADDEHDWWVVSDLTPGLDGTSTRVSSDHVLGISSASTSLAQLTIRASRGRALDLGTGCGVQALHLAEHVDEHRRHRRQRACAGDDPAQRPAQRGRGGRPRRAASTSRCAARSSTSW